MQLFKNEDCLIGMKEYKDKYFDLAIVDPPYGYMESDNLNFRYDKQYKNIAPSKEYWDELYRVSKNQIIWGANYFVEFLKPTLSWLCWNKGNPVDNFSDCELAYTSFDTLTVNIKLDSYGFNHADKTKGYGKTIHPTQKPVVLYKWLLNKFGNEGDIILDTHVGSASSLIACKELGYDYVGFEIDEEYFKNANKRVMQFSNQQQLFKPARKQAQETEQTALFTKD